jgi:prephenate dehydrogenase
MGTSAALALRGGGVEVFLSDSDEAALSLAAALGAGEPRLPRADPELVVLAVPPAAVAHVLVELSSRFLTSTFSDLASVKTLPQVEAETLGADLSRFVGGHPLAGRERSGAEAARSDLFEGRPWVLTPSPKTSDVSMSRAEELVRLCGGDLVVMSPDRHDEAVALVSHVPQVVASLAAARLAGADPDLVALSGQGVRDVTRIAASDPALWTQILQANATFVAAVLDGLAADLDHLRAALTGADDGGDAAGRAEVIAGLLRLGNEGQARIPGKHGAPRTLYAAVPVIVPDRPGELARLFVAAGEAGVNVEDVSIEHSPGHPVGLVELMVRPEHADRLAGALGASGWVLHY